MSDHQFYFICFYFNLILASLSEKPLVIAGFLIMSIMFGISGIVSKNGGKR